MGAGVDVTFDCAGFNKTITTALNATQPGGKVCLVGMGHSEMTVPLTPAAARSDSVEQRLGSLEATMEQIRAMLVDQQTRPRHRRGRHQRRGSPRTEDDDSDRSTASRGGVSHTHRYQGNRRKLEIPIFKGDDAYGWLVRIERYFRLNGVRVHEKLDAAVIALEEKALNWFQWWEEQTPSRAWDEFKIALIRRFQPGILQNPLGPLLNLKQRGTVMEYREKFEMLVAPIRREERVMLDSIFLNGLKEEIQAELKLFECQDLAELMDRALLLEEKNEALLKRGIGGREKAEGKDRGSTTRFRDPGDFGGTKKEVERSGTSSGYKWKGKSLSSAELEDRHKRGLCFKCGEKWGRDHMCKFKHMNLRLCDWSSDEEVPAVEEEEKHNEVEVELKTLKLSLHSKEGLTSNKSFKVWVMIGNRRVLTLIDSGATSNFIATRLVEELGLNLKNTPTYVVEVGNGEKVKNQGVCEELQFQIQGVNFKQHFFLMELSGSEMVLGMDWLASLGNIEANFGDLCLKCEVDGQKYTIQGDPAMCNSQATWKAMIKALSNEGIGFYIHTLMEVKTVPSANEDVYEWEKIIEEFAEVFNMPSGLPPIREHDHAILLKPDANIPNLRPYSTNQNEHVKHLKEILQVLKTHKLFANKKKCSFGQDEIEYLGHLISGRGVSADPKKIEDMLKWPIPKELKSLRGFLGLTGYYRKFVKSYSKIAWPLTQLLKKDNFKWNEEAQLAFDQLKQAMTTIPVLAMPDFNKEFIVETDASGKGIGAVLMQEGRPIAYMSQTLSDRAQQKSVYERELIAIVAAVQKWRPYLLGRHFQIHTDQKSLKYITEQKSMGEDQQKWIAKLLGFDFDIKYKPGKENNVADALSRQMQYNTITTVQCEAWDGLEEEVQQDEKLRGLIQALVGDPLSHPGHQLKGGRLYHEGRVVIPKQSPRIPWLLHEFHDTSPGGHSGYLRTYKKLASVVYWEGMRRRIQEYVQACETCQRNKYQTLSPGGLLQPLPIPTQVWSDISMDFIGGLPKVHGIDTIMVVVDRLTKYAHFIPVSHPYTAKDIAEIFIKEVVKLHGFPKSIVSDRDRVFLSTFWAELFKQAGTKLKYSSAYHPQSDGQTEVTNTAIYQDVFSCVPNDLIHTRHAFRQNMALWKKKLDTLPSI
ncbi:unnamed protein product [Trifolium pratense]|uniref:Uncharacterized protein n=1 Tax=Trifolium pratense TaxID=57577 RepID=A0ACB0L1V3_TRIPR|nr:unnamed protein product [Trifolium pratense]